MNNHGGKTEFLTPVRSSALPRYLALGFRIAGGVTLMALAAQVRFPVPGTEVPATLQSLALLLLAYWLRPAEAFAVMIGYLAAGACGLPVFAAAMPGVWGATTGFLLGFVVAAPAIGLLAGSAASFRRRVFSGLAGFTILFVIGNLWRWGYWSQVGGDEIGLVALLTTGLLPFVPKALVEIVFAATLVGVVRRDQEVRSSAVVH